MNKERILKTLELLKEETDYNHSLTANEIITLLESNDIYTNNRKTIYNDIKILNELGYDVESNNDGFYLNEAPFTLSEIKIIIDSINSLKNLDYKFLDSLKNKLYSFISKYEKEELKKLEYLNKHSDKKFINRLEDSLQAIINKKTIIIKRINKEEGEEICPLFLYRNNDYYYLYYNYLNANKIYHTRFDNIVSIKLTNENYDNKININNIIEHISQSSNAFYSNKSKIVKFKIIKDSEYLRTRLEDDFPNLTFTKDGFVLKTSVNEVFFSILTSYKDSIKIENKKIANEYVNYLKSIIKVNK